MSEEEKQVNQYAMIWNYNAHVEHQHNYYGGKKEGAADDASHDLVDLTFFSMKHFGTMESQDRLRGVLQKATAKMDVNSGRDWVAVYIAHHFHVNMLKLAKNYVGFFTDIEALLPDVLTKVKKGEQGDKRYRSYTEALSSECGNWFVDHECLPPMNEWTTLKYRYHVDNERRKGIQQLVTEIYQGLNS